MRFRGKLNYLHDYITENDKDIRRLWDYCTNLVKKKWLEHRLKSFMPLDAWEIYRRGEEEERKYYRERVKELEWRIRKLEHDYEKLYSAFHDSIRGSGTSNNE